MSAGVEEYVPAAGGGEGGGKTFEVQMELWNWAGRAANELARQHEWGGDFTLAEREAGVENVVTGLRRKLIDSDSEEEGSSESDEDDIKMEDDALEWGDDKMKKKMQKHETKEEEEEEEEGKDDVDMKDADVTRDPLPLEQVLKFVMTGEMPPGI